MRVCVGDTVFGPEHRKGVLRVLESGQLSPGPVCREFEDKFAAVHKARYGLFLNSGTDALRVALLAMKEMYGWEDGDTVLVPGCTFVATANIVYQANLRPVAVHVGMYDGNLNVDALERYFDTSVGIKVVCVIPVHLFGKLCDMAALRRLSDKYGFKILEDSCESMGVGKLEGDVACYSTYACHVISTGVGGLSITNSPRLMDLMRSYANHGRDYANIPGYRVGSASRRFKFDRIGYSARATELQAAIGLVELKSLASNVRKRQEVARKLTQGLSPIYELMLPEVSDTHAFMMYPLYLKPIAKAKKSSLVAYLEKNGIETRDWLSLSGQPCYHGRLEMNDAGISRDLKDHGFYIGCHPLMTDKDVNYVVKTFRNFFKI